MSDEAREAFRNWSAVKYQAEAKGFVFTRQGGTVLGKRVTGEVVDFIWLSLTDHENAMAGRYPVEDSPEARHERNDVTGEDVAQPLLSTRGSATKVVFDVLEWPRDPDPKEPPVGDG